VVSDPAYWRPAEPIPLVGDFSRAQNTLGWAPSVSFDELVNLLVAADLEDGDTEPPNRSS
jgi:GDPmannose 4,6-dehydratase